MFLITVLLSFVATILKTRSTVGSDPSDPLASECLEKKRETNLNLMLTLTILTKDAIS